MSDNTIQTSWNAGEWAPHLNARVDLAKYHSGAALIRNFTIDYRGGATTRPGTRYVLKAKSNTIRLIPFTASFAVTYTLEFGPGYIRFYNNGAPVLETATTITAAAAGPPEVFTDTAHGYSNNDWISVGGNYYIVQGVTANTFTLTDLFGSAINNNPFTLPTSAQRVYTLIAGVPYQAADLFQIKYTQNINTLILCHPNYPPQLLTLISATNWTLAPINFGPTISAPVGLSASSVGSGSSSAQYIVTAVDSNGQESSPSAPLQVNSIGVSTTQSLTWTSNPKAVAYNVYRTIFSGTAIIPGGIPFGFIGTSTTNNFIDQDISPNFSEVSPTVQNPFSGSGVNSVSLTAAGSGYNTSVPSITFAAAPGGGVTALGYCYLGAVSVTSISVPGFYNPNSQIFLYFGYGIYATVFTNGIGQVTSANINSHGTIVSGSVPGGGFLQDISGQSSSPCTIQFSFGVVSITLSNPGTGYLVAPSVTFTAPSGSGAAATSTLGAASSGNPTVPAFAQQRLFLGGPVLSPSQFNMSQPGAPFNFNVTFPPQPDNAIQETLSNNVLNAIKSATPVSAGILVLTDRGAYLLNGGSPGSAVSALDIVANSQAYSGSSDLPPITTPNDLLYVQAKGSIVRDLSFNFYLNNYVGADISILSSHLFYGFNIIQWAFAEEPFKLAWLVRNDGQLLSLTFVKEQELIAWTHHDTQGSYVSVSTVNENASIVGNVDAVYAAVGRVINGTPVTYIERMVELTYPSNYKSSWQVDAGIGYNGAPATTFSGAQHLGSQVVTGVADGVVINFTMPVSGTFVFGPGGTTGLTAIANASIVTVGLSFLPQLQTLALDLGQPTVQGKRKKVSAVTVRVKDTLGLSAGRTFATAVAMKDLVIGSVGTMSNAVVTGLQTTDARTIVDPQWDVFGQFCIQQTNPYPATILGVIPEIEVGDTQK